MIQVKACHSHRVANYCTDILADNMGHDRDSALIFYELCSTQISLLFLLMLLEFLHLV